MGGSSNRSVAQWLSEGLTLFADGDREAAAECWRRVLSVEPTHPGARDYLRAIGDPAGLEGDGVEHHTQLELRDEAVELLSGGLVDEAYELMTTTGTEQTSDLETLALLELLRMHLHEDVIQRLGSSASVPVIEMAPEDLMKFNLPAGAGFLISRIDGHTPVSDLVAVSGMDPFETMHTLGRLLEAGIVGVAE